MPWELTNQAGVHLDSLLTVVAPCGLEDLFDMVLRRNAKQVTVEYFRQRLQEKAIERKWPKVTIFYD